MKTGLVILSLFLATVCGLQDNFTSATQTQNINSLTIIPFSTTIPTSSVTHSSVTPTPSSTPSPPGKPVSGCYSLNYTTKPPSNHSCVKLCVDTAINITSNFTIGGVIHTSKVTIPNAWNVKISGSCPARISDTQERSVLSLKWSKGGNNYTLNVTFLYNQDKVGDGKGRLAQDRWFLESATFLNDSGIKYSINITQNDTDTIVSDIRRAYTCDSPLILELNAEPNFVATFNMSQYTVQPFALNLTSFGFQFLDSCEPGGIPLFVPIIVAGILGVFVLALLFLYAIGRFRMKKKGEYERLT